MFNNIVNIDWSKFKVMEPVKMLRNQKKYIINGA